MLSSTGKDSPTTNRVNSISAPTTRHPVTPCAVQVLQSELPLLRTEPRGSAELGILEGSAERVIEWERNDMVEAQCQGWDNSSGICRWMDTSGHCIHLLTARRLVRQKARQQKTQSRTWRRTDQDPGFPHLGQ